MEDLVGALNTALSIFNDAADSRPWVFPADAYTGTAQYADIVVHSATKWLAGYNDVLAGVIGVNDPQLRSRLLTHRNTIGCVLSPDDAGRLKSQPLGCVSPGRTPRPRSSPNTSKTTPPSPG